MPQCKINFKGSLLESHQPRILRGKMHKEEWNHFVREINLAIHDAQVSMKPTPYIILSVICVSIMVVMLDMGLNGIFGNPQAGTVTLTIFVIIALLCICYFSMGKPTQTCEECVEQICEHYSDEEREIYFFYRHHANTRITENRFYIELFVAADPEKPPRPRKAPTWEPETPEEECRALVPIVEDPVTERQLVLAHTPAPPTSTALTLVSTDTEPTAEMLSLVPSYEEKLPPIEALIPMDVPHYLPAPPVERDAPIQALVPLDAPPPQESALVPVDQGSRTMVPALGQPAPQESSALVPVDAPRALVPVEPAPYPTHDLVKKEQKSVPPPTETALVPAAPAPEPKDALVPREATLGSIAPPPTQEDMARAFPALEEQPPQERSLVPASQSSQEMVPLDSAQRSAPAPMQASQALVPAAGMQPAPVADDSSALVPRSATLGSIAPPPTQEDMARAFPAPEQQPPQESAMVPASQPSQEMVPLGTAQRSAPAPMQQALVPAAGAPAPMSYSSQAMVPAAATTPQAGALVPTTSTETALESMARPIAPPPDPNVPWWQRALPAPAAPVVQPVQQLAPAPQPAQVPWWQRALPPAAPAPTPPAVDVEQPAVPPPMESAPAVEQPPVPEHQQPAQVPWWQRALPPAAPAPAPTTPEADIEQPPPMEATRAAPSTEQQEEASIADATAQALADAADRVLEQAPTEEATPEEPQLPAQTEVAASTPAPEEQPADDATPVGAAPAPVAAEPTPAETRTAATVPEPTPSAPDSVADAADNLAREHELNTMMLEQAMATAQLEQLAPAAVTTGAEASPAASMSSGLAAEPTSIYPADTQAGDAAQVVPPESVSNLFETVEALDDDADGLMRDHEMNTLMMEQAVATAQLEQLAPAAIAPGADASPAASMSSGLAAEPTSIYPADTQAGDTAQEVPPESVSNLFETVEALDDDADGLMRDHEMNTLMMEQAVATAQLEQLAPAAIAPGAEASPAASMSSGLAVEPTSVYPTEAQAGDTAQVVAPESVSNLFETVEALDDDADELMRDHEMNTLMMEQAVATAQLEQLAAGAAVEPAAAMQDSNVSSGVWEDEDDSRQQEQRDDGNENAGFNGDDSTVDPDEDPEERIRRQTERWNQILSQRLNFGGSERGEDDAGGSDDEVSM